MPKGRKKSSFFLGDCEPEWSQSTQNTNVIVNVIPDASEGCGRLPGGDEFALYGAWHSLTPSCLPHSRCNYSVSLPCEFTKRFHVAFIVFLRRQTLDQSLGIDREGVDPQPSFPSSYPLTRNWEEEDRMPKAAPDPEWKRSAFKYCSICLSSMLGFQGSLGICSGFDSTFSPSPEAWVTYVLLFSIFRCTPVVKRV